MNVDKINHIADVIEKHSIAALGFNMGDFVTETKFGFDDKSGHMCNTVACIAGTVCSVYKNDGKLRTTPITSPSKFPNDVFSTAKDILELSSDEAYDLFLSGDGELEDVTQKDAVKVLRHFAKTEKVDWSIIKEKNK